MPSILYLFSSLGSRHKKKSIFSEISHSDRSSSSYIYKSSSDFQCDALIKFNRLRLLDTDIHINTVISNTLIT